MTKDMDSDDVFEHYKPAATSSGQTKDNKRARGESSKTPSKKARIDDPPATAPSKENSPPPPSSKQPASTFADLQPSPKAPSREALNIQPEGSLPSLMVSSARERIYKLSKHRHSQAAITDTASMEANQVLNRGLNEIVSDTLKKANETKEKFKESTKLNYQESAQLKLDLVSSRQEAEELGKRVQEFEEAGARDLKK
ncbi:uncharacterized protein LOC133792217 [Humulus lupulus]|uniref:uncharacterized protein LOC133792217 n=1 Tax=Humulus lupulus TaxID=3486 RepID=UPI002B409A79|nr:uncharacterized protein LOC133792217 [Humulus lupulus]